MSEGVQACVQAVRVAGLAACAGEREEVRVRAMREAIRQQEGSRESHDDSQQGDAVYVRVWMWKGVPPEEPNGNTCQQETCWRSQ